MSHRRLRTPPTHRCTLGFPATKLSRPATTSSRNTRADRCAARMKQPPTSANEIALDDNNRRTDLPWLPSRRSEDVSRDAAYPIADLVHDHTCDVPRGPLQARLKQRLTKISHSKPPPPPPPPPPCETMSSLPSNFPSASAGSFSVIRKTRCT